MSPLETPIVFGPRGNLANYNKIDVNSPFKASNSNQECKERYLPIKHTISIGKTLLEERIDNVPSKFIQIFLESFNVSS
jgi:hypothetical protein